MEDLKGINISKKDLKHLKKLGEGRDAIVYAASNKLAYKIYKDPNNKDFKNALYMIKQNNYDIKLSNLPISAIYVDGEFGGCLLKRIHGFQLQKVFSMLSKKNRIAVLKKIVAATKELTDNYIYPADLANTPFLPGKRSNILLDYKLYPNLIDIDGSGASYTTKESKSDQDITNIALSILFLDLLFGEATPDELDYIEVKLMKEKLINIGFDNEVSNKLSLFEANYDDLNEAIDVYSRIKRVD